MSVERRNEEEPYISVVVASRNDDHGGNLLHRMQLCVDTLICQSKCHRLRAELILVEWNPPAGAPRLAEALRWPVGEGSCSVRIVEVPSQIHGRFKHADRLPLFQMIAKNVGIRRARGRFVLATNVDILFSDELMAFLGSGRLRAGRMYRVDRYDVPADVPLDTPLAARLEYCRRHAFRIHAREGTRNLLTGDYHVVHPDRGWRDRLRDALEEVDLIPASRYSRLHTNACGDFTLMARERWEALRGYPELEMFSFHLDSVFCHAAHHSGARERLLPSSMCVYHIEHAAGSGWTPEGQGSLEARLEAARVPQLDHGQFDAWALQMRRERRPMLFNDADWGLANERLPECTLRG